MEVTVKVALAIFEDMVALSRRLVFRRNNKIAFFLPRLAIIVRDLADILNGSQPAELIIMGIGCAGVLHQLTVPILVPCAIAVSTTGHFDTTGVSNSTASLVLGVAADSVSMTNK